MYSNAYHCDEPAEPAPCARIQEGGLVARGPGMAPVYQ